MDYIKNKGAFAFGAIVEKTRELVKKEKLGPHGTPKEYARTPIGKLPVKYKKNFEWLLGKEWWLSDAEELREKGYDPNIYAIDGGEVCRRANLNCPESHDDLSYWEDQQ